MSHDVRHRGEDTSEGQEIDPLYASLRSTAGFAWRHLDAVVVVSVAWLLCSLPVVTAGPATLGGYRAIVSLRENGSIDRRAVSTTVRERFVHAVALGLFPVVLAAIALIYGLTLLETGAVTAAVLTVVTAVVTGYGWLVSVAAFAALADGERPVVALQRGALWTARHAVAAGVLGIVTGLLLAGLALTTVGVGLLFGGLAFVFHDDLLTRTGYRSATATGDGSPEPAADGATSIDDTGAYQ
ncbi:hypothetical protein [Halococcus sp. IIIV-5B]|uniref:hypothetical protein n=1 Tax=Halococcus sp. IIIV-5B TaxID=2321230 RepID=UPI000E70C83D|nr:hypothetical protein [Halococcus sp. IIIV-5B]RJT06804.1 hypothetical protein D3261_04650 [Halococcus sp. IIIV-5B]